MRIRIALGAVIAIGATLTAGCATGVKSRSTPTADLPRHSSVITATKLAADYYRTTYNNSTVTPKNGWSWATYTEGIQALYQQSGDNIYLTDNLNWGNSNSWAVSSVGTNPDTVKALQTYYDLNKLTSSASPVSSDARMKADLTSLPVSQYDWVDALFMGLPDWTRWANRTGNQAYLTKMDALYAWTKDQGGKSTRCAGKPAPSAALFDATEGLWYRDCTFVGVKDANGKKEFWSRGNGWVIAAMAQVILTLPTNDPHEAKYVSMFKTMAAKLIKVQGSDGMWRASLEDPALYPTPETSGTALMTYALAWGIKAGFLDAPTYLPAVAKAWNGLTTISLQPNGFVANCQAVGSAPGPSYTAKAPQTAPTVTSAGSVNSDEPPYCAGAFILAGSQIAALTSSPSTGKAVNATGQQVGNEAKHVNDGDMTTRWSASGFPKSVTIDLGADYRLSNSMVVGSLDRAYRYQIHTSTDKKTWTRVVDRSSNTSSGTKVDNFTPGTVNARYARLTVTGVFGVPTTWASIQQFAVYDRFAPRVDVARAKTTTGTSAAASHPVTAATDGSSATWWASAKAPTLTAPQYLTVNLGAITRVDTVRVFSKAGAGPKHIVVSISTVTGGAYTTVATADVPNAEGPTQVIFPATNARWVRVSATSSYSASLVALEQFEAFRAIGS